MRHGYIDFILFRIFLVRSESSRGRIYLDSHVVYFSFTSPKKEEVYNPLPLMRRKERTGGLKKKHQLAN